MKGETAMTNTEITIIDLLYQITHCPDVAQIPFPVLELLSCVLIPEGTIAGLSIEQAVVALQDAAAQKLSGLF